MTTLESDTANLKPSSLRECASNRLGFQVQREVAALILANSDTDKLCLQTLEIAKRMGHGKHEIGIHAYLYTEHNVTDITSAGVGIYEVDDPWEFEESRTIYLFEYSHEALVMEKALALAQANVRLDTRDLWRCALDMMPDGLVCTTYPQVLLGLSVKCFKPLEVLEYIKQELPGGLTWTRTSATDSWKMT